MSIQILNGLIKLKRALSEADRMAYTPEEGEPVWSVETKSLYMGDGSTVGGIRATGDFTTLELLVQQLVQDLDQEIQDREDADGVLEQRLDGIDVIILDLSPIAFSGSFTDLINLPNLVNSINTRTGDVVLDKTDVGLDEVDNTSDLDKPISTDVQTALNDKANSTDLSLVAFTGEYDDLLNIPIISYPVTSVNGQTGDVVLDKDDVGLGNVDNTSDLNKPISTATQTALNDKANWSELAVIAYTGSLSDLNIDQPLVRTINGMDGIVSLDKGDIGLGNVDNTSDLNKPISTATQNALDTKANSDDLADIATSGSFNDLEDVPSLVNTVAGRSGDVVLTKADVGLGNVNNTSDLNKPISTATQNALNAKANTSYVNSELATKVDSDDLAVVATTGSYNDLLDKPTVSGQVNADWNATSGVEEILNKPTTVEGYGITNAVKADDVGVNVASLVGGKIPSDQIPAIALTETFVVNSEVEQLALTVQIGDIAVRTDEFKTYVNSTGTNASMGDWTELLSPPNAVLSVNGQTGAVVLGKTDIGLGNVDNTSDLNKPISTATQNALDAKANTASLSDVAFSGSFEDLDDVPSLVNSVAGRTGAVTLTKSDVGLSNVDNTSDLNKPISTATQNALDLKANEADLADVATSGSYNDLTDTPTISYPVTSVNGQTGAVTLAKGDVGLGNVDNTSDLNKPISTATQSALNGKQDVYGSQLANRVLAGPTTGSDEPTFRALVAADIPSLPYVQSILNLTAGDGLTGGGDLSVSRTFTLGTPSTLSNSTTNSVTADSHTHAITGFLPTTGGAVGGNVNVWGDMQIGVSGENRLRVVADSSGRVYIQSYDQTNGNAGDLWITGGQGGSLNELRIASLLTRMTGDAQVDGDITLGSGQATPVKLYRNSSGNVSIAYELAGGATIYAGAANGNVWGIGPDNNLNGTTGWFKVSANTGTLHGNDIAHAGNLHALNIVTTNLSQTITGHKTFTGDLTHTGTLSGSGTAQLRMPNQNITSSGTLTTVPLNGILSKTSVSNVTLTIPTGLGVDYDTVTFVNNNETGDFILNPGTGLELRQNSMDVPNIVLPPKGIITVMRLSSTVWVAP